MFTPFYSEISVIPGVSSLTMAAFPCNVFSYVLRSQPNTSLDATFFSLTKLKRKSRIMNETRSKPRFQPHILTTRVILEFEY